MVSLETAAHWTGARVLTASPWHYPVFFHSFRVSWTPCKLSSTRWPFMAGRASTSTSAYSGGGSWPGTLLRLRCLPQEATIPSWEPPCSTRVMSRKPRRTGWPTDSTTLMASVSSQKVTGFSVAHLFIRAGEAVKPALLVLWLNCVLFISYLCVCFVWDDTSQVFFITVIKLAAVGKLLSLSPSLCLCLSLCRNIAWNPIFVTDKTELRPFRLCLLTQRGRTSFSLFYVQILC